MEQYSETELALLYPPFAAAIRAGAAVLETFGTYLRVVSGLRTPAEQNRLYAQGRTTPGHIVTDARAGYSMHNYGLAADIVPFLSGQTGQLNWKPDTPQYKEMVTALKAQGLTWGGDWKGSLGDFDHFQVHGLAPTPTAAMRASYGDGYADALQVIWGQLADYQVEA